MTINISEILSAVQARYAANPEAMRKEAERQLNAVGFPAKVALKECGGLCVIL